MSAIIVQHFSIWGEWGCSSHPRIEKLFHFFVDVGQIISFAKLFPIAAFIFEENDIAMVEHTQIVPTVTLIDEMKRIILQVFRIAAENHLVSRCDEEVINFWVIRSDF